MLFRSPPSSNPASQDLGFRPGMMGREVSGLHDNAPKGENGAHERHRCRHRPSRARLSSEDHGHHLHRTVTKTAHATRRARPPAREKTPTPTEARPAAQATKGGATTPPSSRSRRSDIHAQQGDAAPTCHRLRDAEISASPTHCGAAAPPSKPRSTPPPREIGRAHV